MRYLFGLIAIAAGFGLNVRAADDTNIHESADFSKAIHETRDAAGGAAGQAATALPITYRANGRVITGTVRIYYIWYGAWSSMDPSAFAILENLARSIGGSPYFNINTTYYQVLSGTTTGVSNSVTLSGEYQDSSYSQGKNLTDQGVANIVGNALNGHLPVDHNGVYFVLATPDVTETSGFCTRYCGWHTYGYLGSTAIKYAFIGDPARCPTACSAVDSGPTPNGDLGADAMASILSHELEEATTDPLLNAWFDANGAENADKCAWTFGTVYRTSNNGFANMNLGGRNYLIQRNWVYNSNPSLQGCALSH